MTDTTISTETKSKPKKVSAKKPAAKSKADQIAALALRKNGASRAELVELTGYQNAGSEYGPGERGAGARP